MQNTKQHLWIALIAILFIVFQVNAQSDYTLSEEHELTVAGTSTLHDWTMTSNQAKGTANMLIKNGQLEEISAMEVVMPVETLKSGKRQMDNNAYEALKSNQHANAVFQLENVEEITASTVKANGSLTVAGNKKEVQLTVEYTLNDDIIHFQGSTVTSFSAFQLSPPTAVFGTIKTGEELTLSFQMHFAPKR